MKRAILFLGLCVGAVQAEVKLAPVFGDYMVLQRGAVAPVWGTAAPGGPRPDGEIPGVGPGGAPCAR